MHGEHEDDSKMSEIYEGFVILLLLVLFSGL